MEGKNSQINLKIIIGFVSEGLHSTIVGCRI